MNSAKNYIKSQENKKRKKALHLCKAMKTAKIIKKVLGFIPTHSN